jgi:hypothetical protein
LPATDKLLARKDKTMTTKINREQLIRDIMAGGFASQGLDITVSTSDYGKTSQSRGEEIVSVTQVLNYQNATPERQREEAEYIADRVID